MMYAALLLGLAGSLHCAGMCSPLMWAVTAHQPFLATKIVYNTGRIVTYALLGAAGAGLGTLFQFHQYQQFLSVAFGGLLVVLGLVGISGVSVPIVSALLSRGTHWVKQQFGAHLGSGTVVSRFMLGALNGLLPCGLTYLALTTTFILPSIWDGVLYMLAFGLGTWPVMIGVGWLMQRLTFLRWVQQPGVYRWAFVVAGILLMARVWTHTPAGDHALRAGVEKEQLCP
ncbi:MAG: sulfite exporter TauE/SafE family protein [Bacteroidota bacterium]